MRLFNTQSRSLERLRLRSDRPVGVYVCGITPYDTTHLGHAYTYSVYDILIRHLETVHGARVRYVQNVTDIDDDILRKAKAVGQPWDALGRQWTERFRTDMARLNMRPPDGFPAATAFIPAIVDLTAQLLASDLAYSADGHVYVKASPTLAHAAGLAEGSYVQLLETANERGNLGDDPRKADPLDAVLWVPAQPGEPAWPSPWGPGRPGWHVECTAMALGLLGDQVDVHGGGADLAFPHHAFEGGLAEAVTGLRPFGRIWTHVAMVEMDGAKMSKSLGNLVMVADLLDRHHPDTLRLYLARHWYRQSWEWQPATLEATEAWRRTLMGALGRASGRGRILEPAAYGPRFTAALDDDLNTPAALEVVMALADDILAAPAGADVGAAQDVLATLAGRVLGLCLVETPPDTLAWPEPETGVDSGDGLPAP